MKKQTWCDCQGQEEEKKQDWGGEGGKEEGEKGPVDEKGRGKNGAG